MSFLPPLSFYCLSFILTENFLLARKALAKLRIDFPSSSDTSCEHQVLIWEARETKDALAVGMSVKIWKVLFPASNKEHLHVVKPTGWVESFQRSR